MMRTVDLRPSGGGRYKAKLGDISAWVSTRSIRKVTDGSKGHGVDGSSGKKFSTRKEVLGEAITTMGTLKHEARFVQKRSEKCSDS
jgi:hypothetical protein